MSEPTIDALQSELHLTPEQAAQVHGLIAGTVDPESFKSVKDWVRQCYNRPRENELIMKAIDEVIETCGVEAIEVERAYIDSYHHNIIATYCNAGDTYSATIVLDSSSGEFKISSWGDYLEAWERANPCAHAFGTRGGVCEVCGAVL